MWMGTLAGGRGHPELYWNDCLCTDYWKTPSRKIKAIKLMMGFRTYVSIIIS
jgi:hypothetical protein